MSSHRHEHQQLPDFSKEYVPQALTTAPTRRPIVVANTKRRSSQEQRYRYLTQQQQPTTTTTTAAASPTTMTTIKFHGILPWPSREPTAAGVLLPLIPVFYGSFGSERGSRHDAQVCPDLPHRGASQVSAIRPACSVMARPPEL